METRFVQTLGIAAEMSEIWQIMRFDSRNWMKSSV